MMQSAINLRRRKQDGFSILEMMFATFILLIGLIAVAQLVPASILMNNRNRTDTASLVYAQRELDQMIQQPLTTFNISDADLNPCTLGDPTKPNQIVGSPLVIFQGQVQIDYSVAPVANYSFMYPDPNDPGNTTYDVRWAVITNMNGPVVTSKRFILGVRQQGGNGYFQPVTLDTMVER
jgi:Tfp pilus assembly protein PilV